MTKKQKEHRIKLIYLIILVNTEYARRKPFKDVWETIAFATEQVMWAVELKKLFSIPVVVGQSEQLKPKPQICYKSNELCKYNCSGLCKESC